MGEAMGSSVIDRNVTGDSIIVQQVTTFDGYAFTGNFFIFPGTAGMLPEDSCTVSFYRLEDHQSVSVCQGWSPQKVTYLGNGRVMIGPYWRPWWMRRIFGSGSRVMTVNAASK
jgi:hypothetical protein